MIYFISGASGSGKTSCIPYLKKLLPNVLAYDFDEICVPPNPTKSWRQEATEAWLQKCLTEKNKDIPNQSESVGLKRWKESLIRSVEARAI